MEPYRIIYLFEYAGVGTRTLTLLPENFLTESGARNFIKDFYFARFKREMSCGNDFTFLYDDNCGDDTVKISVYDCGKLYGILTLKIV